MTNDPLLHARKIGILGGTFNPIHNAHISMARQARELYGLDGVLLIPANDPPHKETAGNIPAYHRLRMVELAAQGVQGLYVNDLEFHRPGKSYTIDTLLTLRERYAQAQFFLIVGSDMLQELHTWRRADELIRLATILCIARKTQEAADAAAANTLTKQHGADIRLAGIDVPPISSTAIRQRVQAALPVETLLPPITHKYIYEQGLYFPAPLARMLQRVQDMLTPKRFAHTAGVMQCAITLAARFGVDTRKARLAALLHDCGRAEDDGALTHAQTSARLAERAFGVRNADVLTAIRLHTTLGHAASALAKVLYIADMIEPTRAYPGVGTLRALAEKDLDSAVCAGLHATISYVERQGGQVDPQSLQALLELSGG